MSKCHNSNSEEKRILSGSQAKTAFAVRANVQQLVEAEGLEHCLFFTLTVGDYHCHKHGKQMPAGKRGSRCPVCARKMRFVHVHDVDEASRRINSLRVRVLGTTFSRCIIVSERHENGGLHFHGVGGLIKRDDIRSGYSWREVRHRIYRNVPKGLKTIWSVFRDKLPEYGFGRSELTPIRKTGGAVASYVSKYIEKNICNRHPADKGKKLVRYHGWQKQQLKPNDFEWDSEAARAWRARAAAALDIIGVALPSLPVATSPQVASAQAMAPGRVRQKCVDGSAAAVALGSRWAFTISNLIHKLKLADGAKLVRDYVAQSLLSQELQRIAGHVQCWFAEHPMIEVCCGEEYTRTEWREMWEGFNLPLSEVSYA